MYQIFVCVIMIDAIINISEITKGMKSVGAKALLKINNMSIIEHQIYQLKSIHRNIKINVITGFEHEKVKKTLSKYRNINIIYNPDYQNSNESMGLKLLFENKCNIERLFWLSSGVLIKPKSITSSVVRNESKIFLLDKQKNNFSLGCSNNTNIEYIFYDLPFTWSECLFLNAEATAKLRGLLKSNSIKQMFFFELVNKLIAHNIDLKSEKISKSKVIKISTIKDLPKIKRFI